MLQLCPTQCDPMDFSLPDSSAHGILQASILKWIAMSSSRDLSNQGIKSICLISPALAGGVFTTNVTWEAPYKIFIYLITFPGVFASLPQFWQERSLPPRVSDLSHFVSPVGSEW